MDIGKKKTRRNQLENRGDDLANSGNMMYPQKASPQPHDDRLIEID